MKALPDHAQMADASLPLGGALIGSSEQLATVALEFDTPKEKEEFITKGGEILGEVLKAESGITDVQIRTDRPIRTQRGGEVFLFTGHGKTTAKEVAGMTLALYRSKSGVRDRKAETHDDEDMECQRRLAVKKVVNIASEGGGVMQSVLSAGRVRVQAFFDMTGLAISIRVLSEEIVPLEKLGFDDPTAEVLRDLVRMRSGLGIVTGQTGSGKSTTLAALIDYVRLNSNRHIVTIEEPVEYRIPDTRPNGEQCISLVTQREVGIQVDSFEDGLVDALRQHPNLIMIGEIRDERTMATCLAAVQTGHLVLTTLHTNGATDTVARILEFFPPEKAEAVLNQLASSLNFVLTQGLFASHKTPGAYAIVYELLVNREKSSRASIRKYLGNKSSIESEMASAPNVKWDECLDKKKTTGEISNEDATANRRVIAGAEDGQTK